MTRARVRGSHPRTVFERCSAARVSVTACSPCPGYKRMDRAKYELARSMILSGYPARSRSLPLGKDNSPQGEDLIVHRPRRLRKGPARSSYRELFPVERLAAAPVVGAAAFFAACFVPLCFAGVIFAAVFFAVRFCFSRTCKPDPCPVVSR